MLPCHALEISLALILFFISQLLYRIYLHPLRRFPGPKLASTTNYYRAYYDIVKRGSMSHRLVLLHEKYGPIVRIAPNELHFSDPSAYKAIYTASSGFHKDPYLYDIFSGPKKSSFGFIDKDLARARKDILNPLFSKRGIAQIQGLIKEKVELFCTRLQDHSDEEQSADLFWGFRCLSMDIILTYCFSQCPGGLEAPLFQHPLIKATDLITSSVWVFRHFAGFRNFLLLWLIPFLKKVKFFRLSTSFLGCISPVLEAFVQVNVTLDQQVQSALRDPQKLSSAPHPLIYHQLLKPSNYPRLSHQDLMHEADTMLFAGSETAANTFAVAIFHLLSAPRMHKILFNEIKKIWPDLDSEPPVYEIMEKLPYLTGVIKEGLRMSFGVTIPLPRIVEAQVEICGALIPAGATVGCCATFIHNSNALFPDSKSFKPERWINASKEQLSWLVSFSTGPRQCLGKNLAYCELYMGFAHLIRKFELTLDNASAQDLEWDDYFTPQWKGRHIHAFVKPRKD